MLTVIFDVDDTLYDQLEPFNKAIREVINPNFTDEEIYTLYLWSRKFSDDVFEQEQAGEITTEALHIYRITEACKKVEIDLSVQQALKFQAAYLNYQQRITLIDEVRLALETLTKHGIPLAILTNGNAQHQEMKINQLGVAAYIPREHHYISGALGMQKPDRAIFDYIEKDMKLNPSETWYVGDAFINDVVGATRAHWNVIWFNHRMREPERIDVAATKTVHTKQALLESIQSLILEQPTT